jgi:hypothetical protein
MVEVPPHGGFGQQPLPSPPWQVVVVISMVVLVDVVAVVLVVEVVIVLVDDVVVVRWVVVVRGTVLVVGLGLVVVVVSRVVLVELTGGATIGRVVGAGANVEAEGGGIVGGIVDTVVGDAEGLVGVTGVAEVEAVVVGGNIEVGAGVVTGEGKAGAWGAAGCLWAGWVKTMALATPAPAATSTAIRPTMIAVVNLACRGTQRQLRAATASRMACTDASEGTAALASSASEANAPSSWESVS